MNQVSNILRNRLWRPRAAKHPFACTVLVLTSLTVGPANAAPEDEVRSTFDRFVTAQNAHDLKAVESLLLGSPGFLWITRGTPVWGHDAALKRFASLYEGTWNLNPEGSSFKVTLLNDGAAQIYVPIKFSIGAPGQQPQPMQFLMNMVLVRVEGGWRISSILPIPAPAQ
jgi:hypothetical protein